MNRNQFRNITLLLLLLFIAQFSFAQNTDIPLDPKVRTGKLPNGFTYFIRQNQTPKNRVVLYLVNKVGSILETEDQLGLAHFIEHMSFNGTTHFPKNQLVDYLQKAGVRFGADLNAYTGFDETVYQLPIPTDDAVLLENGFKIMRDWAQEASLDPKEIDKERGVILEEKRLQKSAGDRMRSKYFPIILNGSRYASRMPMGTENVLKSFKAETLKRFYKDWYRPNLQSLIVVGDIDPLAIEKVIQAQFSDLKNPLPEKPRNSYPIALNGKNQFIALTDKEQTSTQLQLLIKQPAMKPSNVAEYRKMVIRLLYNLMLKQRYDDMLSQANAPFVQASAAMQPLIGGLDAFNMSITAQPDQLEAGFKAAWREIVRLRRFGFSAEELERAQKSYMSGLEAAFREQDKTTSENYAKEYVQYFLNQTPSPGILNEYELSKTILASLELKMLNQETLVYTGDINRDIIVLAPEKDKTSLPDHQTMDRWIKAVELEKLAPTVETHKNIGILARQPVSGKIISEEQNTEFGFSTLTMSNGLKIILKPTSYKNNEVLFTGFAKGGTSLYGDQDYQSAANAVSLVSAAGVGNLNISELRKFVSDKNLKVSPVISSISQGFSGTSTKSDLPTALELLYAYFTEPRNDKDISKSIIDRSYAAISNRANDPSSVFQDSSSSIVYGNHPRMGGPTLEKLGQINPDRAFGIYKERFADASGFTFVFVGNIDTLTIRPLLEKYLGSLPATNSKAQFRDLGIVPVKGRIEKTIYKGSEQKATVNLLFSGDYDYTTEKMLELEALKEVLQIRVLERLREAESGVYTPQVIVSGSKYPRSIYQCQITFGCAPENVGKLVASALDEIQQLKKNGPSQTLVDKWKAEFSRTMETQRQTNYYWLAKISSHLQNDVMLEPLDAYKDLVEKISTEALKDAANFYLNGKNYIRLVLLPEKRTTGTAN